jgi:Trk-type K+ transport system membrane component
MVIKSLIIGTIIVFLIIAGAIIFVIADDARSKKGDKNGKK